MKRVDFLDISLNLTTGKYKPYKKTNNETLYVNRNSNHPQSVLKEIPHAVNKRLQNISSSSKEFNEAKSAYERALNQSGYTYKLEYDNSTTTEKNSKNKEKRNRKRNIIWYNPPFNKSITINLGQKFLKLLNKHFSVGH